MNHTVSQNSPNPSTTGLGASILLALFPSRHGHGFWQHWIHHLPVIIGLSIGVAVMAHLGWFQSFQTSSLDSFLRLQSSRRSDHVVIVTIGDDEFRSDDLFQGTSPLDPKKLGLILKAIAAGKPRLIAVDIDTSSTAKAAEYQQLADTIHGESWPPVIWSCDGEAEAGHHGGHDVPKLHVIPALAGNPKAISGLITLPSDSDGVIRRYRRTFQVASEDHHASKVMDSLPWAVVKEYCQRTPEAALPARLQRLRHDDSETHEPHELLMNYAGDRYSFFQITGRTVLDSHSNREFWSSDKSPIRDKIVLLGGTYRAARDIHPTPVGRVPGVELLAMAIESELQGTGIRFMHEAFAILIDILFGSLLVYFNWRFNSPRVMFLNLLAVGALALVASYITFNTLGYWLNFAVVLVGIRLHNQFDMLREFPALRREVHELREKLQVHEQANAKICDGHVESAADSAASTTKA